jgi:hypothetical protein
MANESMKRDNFFDVPTTTAASSMGGIDLPILYYDYAFVHFFFWVEHQRTYSKLHGTIFKPCRFFNGKAGALLSFFNYKRTAIGSYNEVGLSILCHHSASGHPGPFITQLMMDAKKWSMGAYVINLPVTTEIANAAGRELWGYPKFVTGIFSDLEGKRFNGAVNDPGMEAPLLTLEGSIGSLGPVVRFSKASFISHAIHHGTPLRILTDVDAKYKVNLGFSSALSVNERSSHIMAQNLRDLGMEGKKPFLSLSCEKARMILHKGETLK